MPANLHRRALLGVTALAGLGSITPRASAAACEQPRRLSFSIIPRGDVRKEIAELQPMLGKLEAALGIPVEVYTAPSYGAVVEALLSGAVQLARLGPASYVSAKRADPLLTAFASYANKAAPFQPAGAEYHSLLIVRADSKIADIAAARGKRLALVDPDSTSGALVPKHIFAKQVGMPLASYFSQVGYTGSHTQSVAKLLSGQIDAAFVGSQNLATDIGADPAKVRQIRVIWRSGALPNDPFVLRGQLCDAIKDRIRAAFLDGGGLQGAGVLDKLSVSRFVPVSDRQYRIIREIDQAGARSMPNAGSGSAADAIVRHRVLR